jgi:hypothetical protein
MCGIVGGVAERSITNILIEGLINLTASNKFKVPIPVTFAV